MANRYSKAVGNIWIVFGFTLLNIILSFVDYDSYFLFSAYIPYITVLEAAYYGTGMTTALAIAAAFLGAYLLCSILAGKGKPGWLVLAFVIFAVDSAAMVMEYGFDEDMILDLFFHAWILISLLSGILAYGKLKKVQKENAQKASQLGELFGDYFGEKKE